MKFCQRCGLNEGEFMACEEPDCGPLVDDGRARLDEKGRCCGRKPLVYKRHSPPAHPRAYFCDRCDHAYSLDHKEQIENWAYKYVDGKFVFHRDLIGKS